MDDTRLNEIRERHAAASVGPWRWTGYRRSYQIDLMSGRGDEVMGFKRWGMGSAQPVFCTKGLLYSAFGLTEGCDPQGGGRDRITEIPHPDARFIATSWQDVKDLLAEVDRLRAALAAREEEGA